MKKRRHLFFLWLAVIAFAAIASVVACGGGFLPQSKVDSVRLFATKADKPYTKPGETVTLEALYTDARKEKTRPLKNFWIPVVCLNPRDDLYYLCFAPPALDAGARFIPGGVDASVVDGGPPGGGSAGADAGAGGILGQIPRGVDLAPFLPQGDKFTFTMPEDVIQPRTGTSPYGIALVFNLLCAGKVIFVDVDPNAGPQQVPLQCVDEENQKLPASEYVIGISRVYSYADRTNANPIIDKVTFDGVDVDIAKGIEVETCKNVEKRDECFEHKLDIKVPESSWEPNPSETSRPTREQIWVAYYNDYGDLRDDARLIWDATRGQVPNTETIWRAPYDPVDGTIWAVVHDNRGGANWVIIPTHTRIDPPKEAGADSEAGSPDEGGAPADAGTD